MQWLKQSTSINLKIGPFLDKTDGDTAETDLTIAQADVRLSKNGGDIAQKTEATSCTHDELGIYGCPFGETDTATLGRLQLWVHKAGALSVWHEYMVVPANVWDSMFGADKLQVDMTQCGGSNTPAGAIPNAAADAAGGLPVSDAGELDLDTKLANLHLVTAARMTVLTELIDGGRLDALIDEIIERTANLPDDPADDSDIDSQLAALSVLLTTEIAEILADTNELQGLISGDKLPAQVKGIDADMITAASLHADAGAEIADAVADEVYEGALTFRQMVRIIFAVLAGKSNGGGTATIKFRDVGDTKDRVTATVEADGDRTAITLDGA